MDTFNGTALVGKTKKSRWNGQNLINFIGINCDIVFILSWITYACLFYIRINIISLKNHYFCKKESFIVKNNTRTYYYYTVRCFRFFRFVGFFCTLFCLRCLLMWSTIVLQDIFPMSCEVFINGNLEQSSKKDVCAFEFAVVGSADSLVSCSISTETFLFNNVEQTLLMCEK